MFLNGYPLCPSFRLKCKHNACTWAAILSQETEPMHQQWGSYRVDRSWVFDTEQPHAIWIAVSLPKKVNKTGILSRHYSGSPSSPHYERFCCNLEFLVLIYCSCQNSAGSLFQVWFPGVQVNFCSEAYKQIPKVAFLVREHKNPCRAPSKWKVAFLKPFSLVISAAVRQNGHRGNVKHGWNLLDSRE